MILHATNIAFMNNACLLISQWLKDAGVNAELAASDWGAVITRRAVKKPVAEGGWNIFVTWGSGEGFDNPIGMQAHTANGEAGWFGWPKDDLHEKLRDAWALAATPEERQAIARKLQENAWTYVPMALLGQWAPAGRAARERQGLPAASGPRAVLERREGLMDGPRLRRHGELSRCAAKCNVAPCRPRRILPSIRRSSGAIPIRRSREMRREAPIAFVPQLGSTLLTRRDDIFVSEKRIDVFSSDQPAGLMNRLMGHNMMRKDGEAHMAERSIFFPAVSPKAVRAHWRAEFQAHADRILDAIAGRGAPTCWRISRCRSRASA